MADYWDHSFHFRSAGDSPGRFRHLAGRQRRRRLGFSGLHGEGRSHQSARHRGRVLQRCCIFRSPDAGNFWHIPVRFFFGPGTDNTDLALHKITRSQKERPLRFAQSSLTFSTGRSFGSPNGRTLRTPADHVQLGFVIRYARCKPNRPVGSKIHVLEDLQSESRRRG